MNGSCEQRRKDLRNRYQERIDDPEEQLRLSRKEKIVVLKCMGDYLAEVKEVEKDVSLFISAK